jgi:hypothetical protein
VVVKRCACSFIERLSTARALIALVAEFAGPVRFSGFF